MKKNPSRTSLDSKFWQNFSKHHWQRKAHVWKNIDSKLSQMNADEIFSMLVDYANLCRQKKNSQGFKLFLEGELQYDLDTLQFLPERKDRSLWGYHQRMERNFPDYCLVCDELLQVSSNTWQALTEFTQNLYDQVGFPHRFAELGLYLGNYKKTPFGVHVDGCGVFSFPVAGQKNFRIWSPHFAEKNPGIQRTHQYNRYKKNSQLLQVEPGDMSYWPSQDWHIAESNGSFSATWSLGVWVDRPFQEILNDILGDLLGKNLQQLLQSGTTKLPSAKSNSGEVTEIPQSFHETIDALQKISHSEAADAFMIAWLKLQSRQGLKNFPVARPATPSITSSQKRNAAGKATKLKSTDIVKLRFPQSLPWARLKSSPREYCFAFDSKIFIYPAKKSLQRMIRHLNAGDACHVRDGVQSEKDLDFLQSLLKAGAIALHR